MWFHSRNFLSRLRVKDMIYIFCILIWVLLIGIILVNLKLSNTPAMSCSIPEPEMEVTIDLNSNLTRDLKVVFIGGFPKSGSKVLKSVLQTYSPGLGCRQETDFLPAGLAMGRKWRDSERETFRLQEARITQDVLVEAFSAFALQIITRQIPGANEYEPDSAYLPPDLTCVHEPLIYRDPIFLSQMFPNAKFVFVVRDGRAVVDELLTHPSSKPEFQFKSYEDGLRYWSNEMRILNEDCETVGPDCRIFKYEDLILFPQLVMRAVLGFIGLNTDSKLFEQDAVDLNPPDINSLSKWVGKIPMNLVQRMPEIAPSLQALGYDPELNPPLHFGSNYAKRNSFKDSIQKPDSDE